MTDIRDIVDFIELCLDNEKAYGKTFNIAGADVCDWFQIVPYISEKTGRGVVQVAIPNLWQYNFDQSESEAVLGFAPRYDHKAMVDIAVAMSNNEDVDIIRGDTTMLA
jgi:nucleoside-diphosphate-sugar epimerase